MNFRTIYLIVYTVIAVSVAVLVNKIVTKDYMDEIFHVEMSEKYLDSINHLLYFNIVKFDYWNNKITTFPGLYIFSFLYG